MAYALGRLVHVGDIVVTGRGRKRITYICPYLAYRHGSAPVCIFEPDTDFLLTDILVRQCPGDIEMAGGIPICYRVENIKEEHSMKAQEIKKAIKLPNGHAIAEDDIVIVEKGYVNRSEECYELFAASGKATGRVAAIGVDNITIDFSKENKARVYVFNYSDLKSIALANVICTVVV